MTNETHLGQHPTVGGLTLHKGPKEKCPAPDCEPEPDYTNWGVWCPHEVKVVELDEEATDVSSGPVGRPISPWPCGQCTREEFEAEMAAQAQEAEESLWSEVYR